MEPQPARSQGPRTAVRLVLGAIAIVAYCTGEGPEAGAVAGELLVPLAATVATLILLFALADALLRADLRDARCPRCGAWRMRRVAASSFGFRYFRCDACEARHKRRIVGPWADASGLDDEPLYRPDPFANPWSGPPSRGRAAGDIARS